MDTENIKKSILEDGAFSIDDPKIGELIDTFANNGYPFQREEGLRLCGTILADDRVRDSATSLLEQPGLGMFKALGPHPGTVRALLNRTTDELLALKILLCRTQSRVILYLGSEKLELDAKPGRTGLLELPSEAMNIPGVISREVDMGNGGLIIADGRLFSTLLEGTVIEFGIAAAKELSAWAKMRLPKSPNLEQIVAEMERGEIRMNLGWSVGDR